MHQADPRANRRVRVSGSTPPMVRSRCRMASVRDLPGDRSAAKWPRVRHAAEDLFSPGLFA